MVAAAPSLCRVVILDRDGTLVDFVRDAELGVITPAFHPDQLRLLPGVIRGLRELEAAGYLLAVATNQPGAAKGQIPLRAITRTNAALGELLQAQGLALGAFECCPHHPDGGPGGDSSLVGPCECRKPKPGMLLDIARKLGAEPAQCWVIGDTAADLGAARAAAMRCALVVPMRRCELCPLPQTAEPEPRADIVDHRFDLVVQALLRADAHRASLGA
jgi:D-glycero-D-manno-heptose 1,7-bisphosphate phosphatase